MAARIYAKRPTDPFVQIFELAMAVADDRRLAALREAKELPTLDERNEARRQVQRAYEYATAAAGKAYVAAVDECRGKPQ